MTSTDLISCLMVTADRPALAQRAVACFAAQTWTNTELVIVDDGDTDYRPMIEASGAADKIRYVRVPSRGPSGRPTLGELRNLSIECASGAWMAQWDDDEWYHPERLEAQVRAAELSSCGASALKWTLMRIEPDRGPLLTFRSDSGLATPGTIVFRRNDVRYPHLRRNEDGHFLRDVRDGVGLAVMGVEWSHLFIRVHHGTNTWDTGHFLARLHRVPSRWPAYAWARWVRRDLRTLRSFRLNKAENSTVRDMDCWVPPVGIQLKLTNGVAG